MHLHFSHLFAPQVTYQAQPINYGVNSPCLLPREPCHSDWYAVYRRCWFCFCDTVCTFLLHILAWHGVRCVLYEPWTTKCQNIGLLGIKWKLEIIWATKGEMRKSMLWYVKRTFYLRTACTTSPSMAIALKDIVVVACVSGRWEKQSRWGGKVLLRRLRNSNFMRTQARFNYAGLELMKMQGNKATSSAHKTRVQLPNNYLFQKEALYNHGPAILPKCLQNFGHSMELYAWHRALQNWEVPWNQKSFTALGHFSSCTDTVIPGYSFQWDGIECNLTEVSGFLKHFLSTLTTNAFVKWSSPYMCNHCGTHWRPLRDAKICVHLF